MNRPTNTQLAVGLLYALGVFFIAYLATTGI